MRTSRTRVDTPPPPPPPPPARHRRWPDRARRWVADERAWLLAALATALLIGWGGEEASAVAWLNPLIFVAALAVHAADRRFGRRRLRLGAGWSFGVMVLVGWAVGMVIELTIAAGGDGYGGMHDDTGPSFILAQGYYLPASVLTWWAVRRYGLDQRGAFWFAGAMAWWEALTLGAVAIFSPAFPLAPLLIAYYVSTYALCGMSGLFVIDTAGVHTRQPRSLTVRGIVGRGLVAGAIAWSFFIAWAQLAAALFDFEI